MDDGADAADGVDASSPATLDAAPAAADGAPATDADDSHLFDEAGANPGVWTWFPIEGARCRDGSQAGMGVRVHAGAERLVVFMHGGGVCLNGASCDLNRASFDEADFDDWVGQMGTRHIFNPDNPANPVRDWHHAFISYCTGDVHAGTVTGVDVPGGPADQSFVGYLNMGIMTELLSSYFDGVDQVLLVGSSAGGFGTIFNYPRVVEAFAPAPVTLLDDSGPMVPNNEALRPCLQQLMRDTWNLDAVIPADCASCFSDSGDGLSNMFAHLGTTYPDARFGLLSTTGDAVVRALLGFGRNGCEPVDTPLPMTVADYTAGLLELRDGLPPNWGTYYASGPLHAIIALLTNLSVDGVPLRSWVSDLVAGEVSHVGP